MFTKDSDNADISLFYGPLAVTIAMVGTIITACWSNMLFFVEIVGLNGWNFYRSGRGDIYYVPLLAVMSCAIGWFVARSVPWARRVIRVLLICSLIGYIIVVVIVQYETARVIRLNREKSKDTSLITTSPTDLAEGANAPFPSSYLSQYPDRETV